MNGRFIPQLNRSHHNAVKPNCQKEIGSGPEAAHHPHQHIEQKETRMTLSPEELRHLAITLLTADTDRDRQKSLGPSDLSNGCDFCLACGFAGISRDTAISGRVWGGRVIGTAIHGYLEKQWHEALDPQSRSAALRALGQRFPDALLEQQFPIGVLGSYGPVGGHVDCVLPSEREAIDYKGTTLKKWMLLQDFIARSESRPEPFGRGHKWLQVATEIKPDQYRKSVENISEAVYEEEMAAIGYKVTGNYGQLQLYGLGLNGAGIPVDQLSIIHVARDSSMLFDNPGQDRYDDPTAQHGVSALSFRYDESYAVQLWARAESIWTQLDEGAIAWDFAKNEHCFPCKMDANALANAAP
jgi:hypothetical protein